MRVLKRGLRLLCFLLGVMRRCYLDWDFDVFLYTRVEELKYLRIQITHSLTFFSFTQPRVILFKNVWYTNTTIATCIN